MKQRIVFDTIPTENPDEVIGHARYVINASTGIGMNSLKEIVEEHVPVVNNKEVLTEKEIIRTDRYECPCCNTELTALVRVGCQGQVTSEWKKVEGLYRVSISPDHGDCLVAVEKLTGTTIFQGRTSYLPRKNYKADPKARKEIEDRNAMFAELARKNPGKVMQVSGIETDDDLTNLIKTAVEKFSDM